LLTFADRASRDRPPKASLSSSGSVAEDLGEPRKPFYSRWGLKYREHSQPQCPSKSRPGYFSRLGNSTFIPIPAPPWAFFSSGHQPMFLAYPYQNRILPPRRASSGLLVPSSSVDHLAVACPFDQWSRPRFSSGGGFSLERGRLSSGLRSAHSSGTGKKKKVSWPLFRRIFCLGVLSYPGPRPSERIPRQRAGGGKLRGASWQTLEGKG